MRSEFKYLIFKNTELQTLAIIFPKEMSHKDVARIHRASEGPRLISAGFCMWFAAESRWSAYGKSESLNGMAARPEDVEILTQSFPLHQE